MGGARHSLVGCRELHEAHVICSETAIRSMFYRLRLSDIACMYRQLLETPQTTGDLGRQPDNAGGILRNSCRMHCQPAKLRAPARDEIRTVRVGMHSSCTSKREDRRVKTNLG